MKRPNLAWRNHCIFSSCDLGAGSGLAPGCARAAPAESSARQIISDKLWGIPRFIGSLLGDPLFPHKTVRNSREAGAVVDSQFYIRYTQSGPRRNMRTLTTIAAILLCSIPAFGKYYRSEEHTSE